MDRVKICKKCGRPYTSGYKDLCRNCYMKEYRKRKKSLIARIKWKLGKLF